MRKPGFTLIELVMVTFIMTILGGIVSTVIVKSFSSNQQVENQALVQRSLSLGLDRFSRVMRSTTHLLEATNTNVKIRGYPNVADTAPSEINFYLTGTQIRYSVIPPTGSPPNYTYNPADAKTYQLLPRVTNTVSQPIFVYYDETNTALASPIVIADVKAVEFRPIATDANSTLTKPITATSRATLRNFKTNL